jgi:hypothetical protein
LSAIKLHDLRLIRRVHIRNLRHAGDLHDLKIEFRVILVVILGLVVE